MNDCEIVDNIVKGKKFWYCRTHKLEAPNAFICEKGEIVLQPTPDEYFNVFGDVPHIPKRGDDYHDLLSLLDGTPSD